MDDMQNRKIIHLRSMHMLVHVYVCVCTYMRQGD